MMMMMNVVLGWMFLHVVKVIYSDNQDDLVVFVLLQLVEYAEWCLNQ